MLAENEAISIQSMSKSSSQMDASNSPIEASFLSECSSIRRRHETLLKVLLYVVSGGTNTITNIPNYEQNDLIELRTFRTCVSHPKIEHRTSQYPKKARSSNLPNHELFYQMSNIRTQRTKPGFVPPLIIVKFEKKNPGGPAAYIHAGAWGLMKP